MAAGKGLAASNVLLGSDEPFKTPYRSGPFDAKEILLKCVSKQPLFKKRNRLVYLTGVLPWYGMPVGERAGRKAAWASIYSVKLLWVIVLETRLVCCHYNVSQY
jgi:hypothetical protein